MGERKDLRDLLRDTDFTQKRIIDDLAGSETESVTEREVTRDLRRSDGGDFMKNIFVGLLLIGIVVGSFWVSFLVGKKVLVPPVKNIPTYDSQIPAPIAISKDELENATPIKEDETPIPEREIKAVEKTSGLPRPISSAKSFVKKMVNATKPAPQIVEESPIPEVEAPVKQPEQVQLPVPTAVSTPAPVVVKPLAAKVTTAPTGRFYKVISGTFKSQSLALKEAALLKAKGFQTFVKRVTIANGSQGYRVQVGAFDTKEKALPLVKSLRAKGFNPAMIIE